MAGHPSKITIDPCPRCEKRHEYPLEIESSFVMALMTPDAKPRSKRRRFVRIFRCPAKRESFRGTITLEEDSLESIHEVVVGPALGDKAGRKGE